MRTRSWISAFTLVLVVLLCAAARSAAQERYAIVVTGASGGQQYAEQYDEWRQGFVETLTGPLGLPADHVTVLAEREAPGVSAATRENVRRAVETVRKKLSGEDVLLIVLIGHGTYDGADAKFNLVGPDLEASAWSTLLEGLPGRLVFVNTTSTSFPFLERLAGPNRVIVTATDSVAQRYDTIFPQFFLSAFHEPSSDLDKNNRVSIWEAFAFASASVKQWYEQQGRLTTERAMLDDDGDGVGREAEAPGEDGALARRLFLQGEPAAAAGDPALAELIRRRTELEGRIEEHKALKGVVPDEQYTKELERLLLELARVSREIREKS